MGVVCAIAQAAGPGPNGTERNGNGTEIRQSCVGDRTANAERAFRFNGTERNGNVTIFMPPTVAFLLCTSFVVCCIMHIHMGLVHKHMLL